MSVITTLLNTDNGASSLSSINTNFSNLNSSKLEAADITGKQNTLTNSAGLLAALSDETGTGLAVFNTSPTLVTPTLGVASATSINGATITSGTLNGSVTGTNTGDNATNTQYSGLAASKADLAGAIGQAFSASTLDIGNADTTLSRVSAGVIAVEGAVVVTTAPGTSGNVLTSNGTIWTSATPAAGGASLWTAITATRISNTTCTVVGDQTAIFKKGMIIRWTESAVDKVAMVSIPSTFGATTTITFVGSIMASVTAFKYSSLIGAEQFQKNFAYAGTLGSITADAMNAYYATEPMHVIGIDLQNGTSGTTNSFTIDCNKNGTTMFTTKPTLATTVASSPLPFTADTATTLALGDRISIDIDAIMTTAGIDAYIQLYLFPKRFLTLS